MQTYEIAAATTRTLTLSLCGRWDQASFDLDHAPEPLDFFIPMIRGAVGRKAHAAEPIKVGKILVLPATTWPLQTHNLSYFALAALDVAFFTELCFTLFTIEAYSCFPAMPTLLSGKYGAFGL